MMWILAFKLINMSDWPLWHPMWISSVISASAAKCLSLTLFIYFIQLILSIWLWGVWSSYQPNSSTLLSMDWRTGFLNTLWISTQAVEIHPIFVGLILVSPSKMGKKPYWLVREYKEIHNWAGTGFACGGGREQHSGRSLPPKLPGVLQRDRKSRTSWCMSVLSRDVSGRVICPQLRWLLTMKWFNLGGIRYRPCNSKKMACIQICKLNYFILHTEFQSLEGEIMTCNMFLRRNTQW